jgi:hypothetical protein
LSVNAQPLVIRSTAPRPETAFARRRGSMPGRTLRRRPCALVPHQLNVKSHRWNRHCHGDERHLAKKRGRHTTGHSGDPISVRRDGRGRRKAGYRNRDVTMEAVRGEELVDDAMTDSRTTKRQEDVDVAERIELLGQRVVSRSTAAVLPSARRDRAGPSVRLSCPLDTTVRMSGPAVTLGFSTLGSQAPRGCTLP